jgi:hypothetical protein
MVSDFSLKKGLLSTRTLLLVTKEANVHGTGSVNLRSETIDYRPDGQQCARASI